MSPHRVFDEAWPDPVIGPIPGAIPDPPPDPAAAVRRYVEYVRLLEDVAEQVGAAKLFWCSTPLNAGSLREAPCGECPGCRLETAADALREFQKASNYWPRGRLAS